MKENLKLGMILLIITAIAGFLLGGAYVITKEPIEKQAAMEKQQAMQEILPEADSFKVSGVDTSGDSMVKEVNEGLKGSEVVGYAIKVTPKGFGGAMEMMVGISKDGKVGGIKILAHSETPGLGANAPNPSFSGQFKGKPASIIEVIKSGTPKDNEISAITGATITSKAVASGVNDAINFYTSKLKGGQK